MAEELKACDLCGAKPKLHGNFELGYLIAHDCRFSANDDASLIKRWNTRAQLPSQGGEAVYRIGYAWINRHNGAVDHVAPFRPTDGGVSYGEPLMTVAQHQRILAASAGSGEPVAWAVTARKKGVAEHRAMWRDEQEADDWLAHFVGRGCEVTKTPLYTHPADQVAEGTRAVPVELLERVIRIYDSSLIDAAYWTDMGRDVEELRALLGVKE